MDIQAAQIAQKSVFQIVPNAVTFLLAAVAVPFLVTAIGVLLRRKNGAVQSAFVDLYLFLASLQFASLTLGGAMHLSPSDIDKFSALLVVLGLISVGLTFLAVDLQSILEERHFQLRIRNDRNLRPRTPTVVSKFPYKRWGLAWLGVYLLLAPTLIVLLIALHSPGNPQ